MLNQQVLFVADTAFINSATIKQHNLLSVFPMEERDGAYRASLDNLLERSKLQSAYYDTLLSKLIPVFGPNMLAAGSESQHFVRPVMVTVTSLFVDRCIRVLHRIRQQQGRNIAVVKVEPMGDIQWLCEINQSWRLNQEIIQRIMHALSFEKVHVFDLENYPEYPNEQKQRNLLFRPQQSGISGIVIKILSRYYNLLRRIPSGKARFHNFGFGADNYYLSRRGLLGPLGIIQKPLKIELEPTVKSTKLRDNLLAEIVEIIRPHFELLLSQLDPCIQRHELSPLSKAYAHIFIDWFPIVFLEGLSQNIKKITAFSNTANILGIIGHDAVSDVGYLTGVSARLAGKTVIGVQHGGHYGYIEDMSIAGQFEYSFYDKMITWGWTHIDSHLPQCETIPLPSPKLSEQPLKANYLRSVKRLSVHASDILFLSNLFHRFPHVSTCGQARVDFIDEITSAQEDLVRTIKDAQLTMDHKPYSLRDVDLYPEHYRCLEAAGGANYRLLKSKQKGLSVDLIKTCRIVLWDQIGSGTLECFTSDIPTIVYWKRIYSRDAPWARGLIADLERCGVIHTDAGKLAQEIKTYLADPEGWMTDKARKEAIQAFSQKFSLTDTRWYESWKHQLFQLYSGSRT
jgi:hypothetical protein